MDDHYLIFWMAATTPHCQAEYVIGENTKRKDEAPPSGSSLHLMPCKIHCTCDKEENTSCRHPASVDTFFDPVMRKTPAKDGMGEEYSATFRGRPLRGVLLDVAEGYAGQVLRKSDGHGDLESGMEVCIHCILSLLDLATDHAQPWPHASPQTFFDFCVGGPPKFGTWPQVTSVR